jgi:high affinity sulfate transporter 1
VNPDSAACTIVAATLAPLAAVGSFRYSELSIALTMMVGFICIIAGLLHLGAIASFLSRPILTGYMNGIALSIIASQLGAVFGFRLEPAGFFRRVYDAAIHLSETNIPTFQLAFLLFVLMRVLKRLAPRVPAPLVVAVLGVAVVYLMNLQSRGVAIVGSVPSGFPWPLLPRLGHDEFAPLFLGACSLVLVSFCSMMPTARAFAAKNGYSINANQDFIALGASNLASGLGRGFVVSGADSRTAVADSAGGQTQLTSVVAALIMAIALIFFTGPLAYLPTAALAAILISSAIGLFDFSSLRRYYHVSPPEFRHSVVAMLGVMTVGVLPGIGVAVALALIKLATLASRPHDALLGVVEGPNPYAAELDDGAQPIDGLVIYRFNSALLFFNADYFRQRVREMIDSAKVRPEWVLLDASSMPLLDTTGADALESLRLELQSQGIKLGIARCRGIFKEMLNRTGLSDRLGDEFQFSTVTAGIRAFQRESSERTAVV